MLKARGELSQKYRREAEKAIGEKLSCLKEVKRADTLCIYYPVKGEVDLLGWADRLNKRVCLPKVAGRELLFGSISQQLIEGRFGIPEPKEADVEFEEIDIFVVPGVAYDWMGYRLGYGGGYYDRLLKRRLPHQLFVGVCFHLQLVEELPREPWDRAVDVVVTEKALIRGILSQKL